MFSPSKRLIIQIITLSAGILALTSCDKSTLPVPPSDREILATDPAWSPDGSRIAFLGSPSNDENPDIYIMNSDGTNRVAITDKTEFSIISATTQLVWSPDGSKIIFTAFPRNSASALTYIVSPDGTGLKALDNIQLFASTDLPTWSPDGTQLAFSSVASGTKELYIMNADGTGENKISNELGFISDISWSPAGSKICFTSPSGSFGEIYTINVDGSLLAKLTNNLIEDTNPKWSFDASKIIYKSRIDRNLNGSSEIYVMDTNGSNSAKISDLRVGSVTGLFFPSPTENTIAYIAIVEGELLTYTVDLDGRNHTLVSNENTGISLSWSPDGAQLAVSIDWNIYTMNPDGTNRINLTGN